MPYKLEWEYYGRLYIFKEGGRKFLVALVDEKVIDTHTK